MTAESKGKVERSVSHVKKSLWGGVTFTDLDDLNRQAYAWCERINSRVHRTTHVRPGDRLAEEKLLPEPSDFAWERFATEERHPSPGMATFLTMACSMDCPGRCTWQANRCRCASAREWYRSGQRANRCLKLPNVRDRKTACRTQTSGRRSPPSRPCAVRLLPWAICNQPLTCKAVPYRLQEYDQYCGVETLPEVVA